MINQQNTKDGLSLTLNKMGYMNTEPEPYNQAFINYSASCSGTCLEIGTAYGITAIEALKKGAKIIANDLSSDHLNILKENTPEDFRKNLTLLPGSFPEAISLPNNSVEAVLSSRMLNFIRPEILPEAFKAIFNWIKPGGKFFLLVSSPYMGNFQTFLPHFLENKKQNQVWPGFLNNLSKWAPKRSHDLPDFIHLLDRDDVVSLLVEAGFLVEKIGYSPATSSHPEDMKHDGREHVGAIAIKPSK